MSASRTSNSIRNAKISLLFSLLSMIIGFISRKFFLDALSSETLGLRVTIGGFLSMLNLVELGIGAAIGVFLYKPLYDQDHDTINEIMSIQGWLYRNVTIVVLLASIVLLLFFPQIFSTTTTPVWYSYATFIVFLIPMLLSYVVNYKSILISVAQKSYKITTIMASVTLAKTLIQMLVLLYVYNPYAYWLASELVTSLLSVYIIDRIVYKEYPWLTIEVNKGRLYIKKYPDLLKRTGQIFFHNVSGTITSNLSPIVISSVASYSKTGDLDNYKNLTTNIRTLIVSLFSNLTPAIGNLLAEGNKEKIYSFFWEIQSFVYFVAAIGAFAIYTYSDQFISLWLGEAYVISPLAVFLVAGLGYIDYCRRAIDSYISSSGLYKDIGAPIVEATLNIALSIILGFIIGWEGVLLGALISLIVIAAIWKPYFVFKNLFHRSGIEYFSNILKFYVVSWGSIFLVNLIINWLEVPLDSFMSLCLNGSWITLIFGVLVFGQFYLISKGFRRMTNRFVILIKEYLSRRNSR